MTVTTAIRVTNRYSIASIRGRCHGLYRKCLKQSHRYSTGAARNAPFPLDREYAAPDRGRARARLCPGGSPRHRGSSKRSPCPGGPPPARPNRLDAPDAGPGVPPAQLPRHGPQAFRTPTQDQRVDLKRHRGRRCLGPSRKPEDVNLREPHGLAKHQRLCELLVSLTGKAHDDVGGHGRMGQGACETARRSGQNRRHCSDAPCARA